MSSVPESAAPEGESHATQAPHDPVVVIDDRENYLAAVAAIAAGDGPIGIDAERASGYRYSQRAYLIQIYRRGAGTFLFDPPAIGDFAELNDVIAAEEWILHAATQDLMCLREVGLYPTRLFDTELGARLAGLPRVGLGTVVEHLLGIHLAKEHSSADWSTRPLPQAWLVYAALDVELLVDLREALGDLLDSADKHDIAQQEFDSVLGRDLSNVRAEPWRRLSGVHSLRGGKNLAIARELWLARDVYAQEVDTAPGRLVPDSALLAAARFLPESKRQLSAMKEFSGRASRTQIDRWWDAIQAGLASTDIPASRVASDALPPPRVWSDKNPEADVRLKAARAVMSERSEEMAIPIENLLTPDYLRRISWNPPAEVTAESIAVALVELGARQWQIDTSAQSIAQAFVEAHQTPEDSDDTKS
ncbi:HRDC domain-containing protein [Salinibacterium sp. M195]|uniref:HRDC domain-containing protein n=1 Tax=Salinibacterium sp. M195 TaxID=2583374 RepID=UPI001C62ED37|nr:HRDC domain-containing protein [Salinibacterium sp. M195]QYH36074.1 ribonuclease D [Salinibacterium sp. M195]